MRCSRRKCDRRAEVVWWFEVTFRRARRGSYWQRVCRCFIPRRCCSRRCWRAGATKMLARNLAPATIRNMIRLVRAFAAHANDYPWLWSWSMAHEWFADLRSVRHVSVATVRGDQVAIRGFCRFITNPGYGWAAECEQRFGTHPMQVVTEVNAAVHVADGEADPKKRAFTRAELQAVFDYADEQVALKRSQGRKGWLLAFLLTADTRNCP